LIEVERFAVPEQADAQFFLDDLGTLQPPTFLSGRAGDLVKVKALAGTGPFCLLGEPGAGKTTALRATLARHGSPVRWRGPRPVAVRAWKARRLAKSTNPSSVPERP
jgi:hypothetical protein